MRLASLSQRFFSKGEEQEANGYENVVLDEDTPPSPDLEFDSFDKIPHRRRPLLAITALLVSVPVVGYVAWKSTRGPGGAGSSVHESARAMVGGQPSAGEPPTPASSAGVAAGGGLGAPANPQPAPAVIPSATCQPGQTASSVGAAAAAEPARRPTDEPAKVEAAAANPALATAPSSAVQVPVESKAAPRPRPNPEAPAVESNAAEPAAAEPKTTAESESSRPARKPRSGAALRGYVWSPEANALVPAGEPVKAEPSSSAPPSEPSVAPVEEPKPAGIPRIAPPETGPLPAEKAPIIE